MGVAAKLFSVHGVVACKVNYQWEVVKNLMAILIALVTGSCNSMHVCGLAVSNFQDSLLLWN